MKNLSIVIALLFLSVVFASSTYASTQEPLVYFNNVEDPSTTEEILSEFTASDDLDGIITDNIIVTEDTYSGNETILGDYLISLQVTDSQDQTTYLTIHVQNKDINPPLISFENYDSNTNIIRIPLQTSISQIIDEYIPQSYQIIDSYEGTLPSSVISYNSLQDDTEAIDTSIKGDYPQVIQAKDSSGNIGELDYILRVQDLTKPVIDGPLEIIKKDAYILSSNFFLSYFTASDDIDGNITDNIIIESNEYIGNADKVGTYEVVLSISDADGNKTYHTLVIKVNHDMLPYLVIDQYEWILPNTSILDNQSFIQELKRIGDLPNLTYVFNSVTDTYTDSSSVNGGYEKAFILQSSSGEQYSRDISISVVDPNENIIEGDPTFLEGVGDFFIGGWAIFKRIWWILIVAFLVIIGLVKGK